jgi:hypothetical protein
MHSNKEFTVVIPKGVMLTLIAQLLTCFLFGSKLSGRRRLCLYVVADEV